MTGISAGNKKAALFSISAGTVMMLCLGILYAWSIFVVPLEESFKCERDEISRVFSVSLISFCAGGFITGGMRTRGIRSGNVILVSAVSLVLGFVFSAMADELWHIHMAYGVLVGLGIGMGYNVIITTIVNWFPDARGTISGILMMGYGLGPLIIGSICSDMMELIGWRWLFVCIAIVFGLVMLIGSLVIYKVSFAVESNFKPSDGVEAEVLTEYESKDEKGMRFKQIIRRSDFWMYYFWSLFFGSCNLSFVGNVAPTALEIGVSSSLAALLVGIVSLFNGFGRFVMGIGYDKLGLRKMLILLSVFFFMAVSCLCLSVNLRSITFFSAACGMMGLCLSGLPTSMAVFMFERFGPGHYSENVAGYNTVMILQSAGTALFASLVIMSGSYANAYQAFVPAGLMVLSGAYFLPKSLVKEKGCI